VPDGDVRTLGFWVRVVWDVVCSAPALRAEATRTVEVIMKLAAILTVLLGAFGILGAMNEWGAASQHAGTYVLAIVLGVAASLLLLGAGSGSCSRSARQRGSRSPCRSYALWPRGWCFPGCPSSYN